MRKGILPLSLLILLSTVLSRGQATSAPQSSDFAQEALVHEHFSRKLKFENDGTASREDTGRVKIQSEAGLQRYGVLTFSYPSATSEFVIAYVRVRKADGTVIETPPENVQDMPAQITREAPFYSDLHEKHVAVKGLSVGDVLEYRVEEHTTKPLVPGQFWTEYRFTEDEIILDEQLEINVPKDRSIKIKSAEVQPEVHEENGRRIYRWRRANLKPKDISNDKQELVRRSWLQARGRLQQPDVLISSFSSWEEVGRWYGGLQQERVTATPEVLAKAKELTKDISDEDTRIRALYDFVSTRYRYIGVAFGIGRYQPHPAAEVLANQYGDCKDKHTLLASLLDAAGITAFPALINSTREIDPDVPSPGQFDHVITAVPRQNNLLWLDSTPEIGPYQYLLPVLRDKSALVIAKGKVSLLTTPADSKVANIETFHMKAKLNDSGTLEGIADLSARGDLEVVLRAAFRLVPLSQWKDLLQRISYTLGFGGDVSDVTASAPEKTDAPFSVHWKYTRKDFGDWPNRRIVAPTPMVIWPGQADDEVLPRGPTWMGPTSEFQFDSEVELPAEFRPELPTAVHLKNDFAIYDATYEFKDGKLLSTRHLKTLLQEAPATQREQYKHLVQTVRSDYGVFIPLTSGSDGLANVRESLALSPTVTAIRTLPDSPNAEAVRLENEANEDISKNDFQGSLSSLYRAVADDPKFTRAWVKLGTLLLQQKQVDAGIDAFHKAISSDPDEPAIPKVLGLTLMGFSQFDEAVTAWQDFLKAHPDDYDANANLGMCLFQLRRYSDAAAAYESALKAQPNRADMQAKLASMYLLSGDREKAGSAYSKLQNMDANELVLNNAAYEMANEDLKLPQALEYATKAARAVEEKSQKIALADLTMKDVGQIFTLSAYWDTLGWVDERMSHLDAAEQYLRASWTLTQDGVVAGHLCHLYKRVHKNASAIQMCQLAINRIPISSGLALSQSTVELNAAKENLKTLTGTSSITTDSGPAADIVIHQRTFRLPRFLSGTESAEFWVLFASDGTGKSFHVEDTKFISGSEKMKAQGKQLKTIQFGFPAPTDVPTRFVRRGILGCYQYTGCSFLLLDPQSVQSLK